MNASDAHIAYLFEARFHRDGQRAAFVVVGYVFCDGPELLILEPHHSPRPPRSLLSNLKYIVLMGGSRTYEFLSALENPFWSFVRVGTRLTQAGRANDN